MPFQMKLRFVRTTEGFRNLTIASPISTIATSTSPQPTNTTRHNLVIVDFGSDSHSLSSRSSDSPSSNSISDPKERPEFYDEEIPTGLDTSKVLEPSHGFPSKNASILFDKWIWTIREVETKIRAKQWRKTFKNKRAIRANVTGNGDSIVLTKPTTAKEHYAIVFETTQLIGDEKRVREVYKILVSVINGVPVNESTKSTYAFGDERYPKRGKPFQKTNASRRKPNSARSVRPFNTAARARAK